MFFLYSLRIVVLAGYHYYFRLFTQLRVSHKSNQYVGLLYDFQQGRDCSLVFSGDVPIVYAIRERVGEICHPTGAWCDFFSVTL
jgi:hypothetical protein